MTDPDIPAPPESKRTPRRLFSRASNGAETSDSEPPKSRSLGPLRMVYRETAKYPDKIAFALLALFVTAAATLAIPAGFKLIIDRGFAAGGDPADIGRWFRYLFMIVGVLAIGTAFRFYFVSWLGERVVADLRKKVQDNLLRQAPGFYETNTAPRKFPAV